LPVSIAGRMVERVGRLVKRVGPMVTAIPRTLLGRQSLRKFVSAHSAEANTSVVARTEFQGAVANLAHIRLLHSVAAEWP